MGDTPRHEYNLPSKETTDWHTPLNDNFEKLDSDVAIRDTEANKGEYEPKDGAKYEATDSGAVYYGDGTSWVLVDREFNSIQAEDINGNLTPQDNTINSIQQLLDNYKNPDIRLKPGVLYQGDTQLYIDSVADNGSGRNISINALGAGVNYTGSKKYAVRIEQGDTQTSSGQITKDANQDNAGSIEVIGGTWVGPGKDYNGEAVFRQNPAHAVNLYPTKLYEAEHGILVAWKNGWNEGCHWGVRKGGSYTGDQSFNRIRPKYLVRLAGSKSGLANDSWTDGNSGRSSGRGSRVTIDYWGAADEEGAVTFWQDHVSLHGGRIKLSGFVPRHGTHYKLSGNYILNESCDMYFECEGGSSDSVAVDVGDNTHTPRFVNPRIQCNGKQISASGNADLRTLRDNGVRTREKVATWALQGPEPGNSVPWLKYLNEDGSLRYGLADAMDGLALMSNELVWVINQDGDMMPIKASEYVAHGDTGTRSYLGTFSTHPQATNGDTWYIDGSESTQEGFYGKKSGGVVQLG